MSDPVRLHPVVAPVAARPPLIDDLMMCEEAGRITLFECLAHLSANVEAVVNGRNLEGLHQMRVALRRLRAALSTFGDNTPVFVELNARAKAFTNTLGQARDLDVFLDELLLPAVAKLDPQNGFDILRDRAEHHRARSWNSIVAEIAGEGFARFQDDIADAAQQYGSPRDDSIPIRVVVPAMMAVHYKRAKKRGRHLKDMDAAGCHRLRIALKRLRYASEFFAPLYKQKTVRAWVEPLKELQDLLGHLNDVAQVRVMLGRLMMEETASGSQQAELSHAAGLIQGWHQAQASYVAKKTLKRWNCFKKTEPFWV